MPSVSSTRHFRVTVDGGVIPATAGISITSSLEQLCRVCNITYASQPSNAPVDGDTVLVEFQDITAGATYPLFGGIVDGGPSVESQPYDFVLRAVDQLADLRIIHTGADLDLTGMLVHEAKMAVLDYCAITYDVDDIVQVNYELGQLEPIKWLSDGSTTGAQIIQEIDRVFGLTTQTIGNNRVISFRYELLPTDATGLYRTFTKGASFDFSAHHRDRGGRDDIQTAWSVQGVSHEFNEGNCTLQPWAKAVAGTARVGRSRRVPEGSDQSDLVQDEALAEWWVRRLMRETSGIPDTGSASTATNRNYYPGMKVAVYDPSYGIRALPRYYCVTETSIEGIRTDLTLRAGPPGSEGTVTSGGQQICNDVETDVDLPGDFEPPDFDFPPLIDPDFDTPEFPDFGIDLPTPDLPSPELPGDPIDPEDPFTDCTQTGELVDFTDLPWRESGTPVWRIDGTETLGVYTLAGTATLTHNTTEAPTVKSTANDVVYAQDETVCVSGTVKFCDFNGDGAANDPGQGPRIHIRLFPADIGDPGSWSTATFWAEPGADSTDGTIFGISGTTENTAASYDARVNAHMCVPLVVGGANNNGGYLGSPVAYGSEADFSVCFQLDTPKMRNYYSGDFGAGYHEDIVCGGGTEIVDSVLYETCSHPGGHILQILLIGEFDVSTPECPWVELTNVDIGFGTCAPNEDYVPPDQTGGRG